MNIIKRGFIPIKSGFTLVELLIVISLLGAIALIVIAAINPIEQANRARDARYKADSSQLLSAIQRYYAANSNYPWVYTGSGYDNEDSVGWLSAADPLVGVCLDAGCADGRLVSTNEILTAFKSRDFITTTVPANKIYVGKATASSSSPYACFIPISLSVKNDAISRSKVWHLVAADGTRNSAADCTASVNWATTGGGCYVCIPE